MWSPASIGIQKLARIHCDYYKLVIIKKVGIFFAFPAEGLTGNMAELDEKVITAERQAAVVYIEKVHRTLTNRTEPIPTESLAKY